MAEVDYSRETGKSNANSTASSATDSFADLNSAAAKNDAILEKNNVEFDKTPYQEKLDELKQRYETNTAFQKDMRKLKADSRANPKQGVDPATDKFQKDQTVISSLLEHYGKPGKDKNSRFDSNSIKNISELVKHNGPVNVLGDAQKQVQAEKHSDRIRIEAFQELLDSDPKKDEKFTDKLANANQLLKNPAKLSEKQQTAMDYNPNVAGAAYVEKVGKVNTVDKGNQAAPANASAAPNASASTESNPQQSSQSDKQPDLNDKKASNSEYYDRKMDIFNNPTQLTLRAEIQSTYYNSVNDYRRKFNSNNPAYVERDKKMGQSCQRLDNYENDLMRASQMHQNDVESGSNDSGNSKYYLASILAKGPGSKKPSDEKVQQQLQKLDNHGFKNVVGNELKHADATLDEAFLKHLALNAELSKKHPTQEDKELASAAMEPGYRPTYDQAASQAHLIGVSPEYAGNLAYEAVARDAESNAPQQKSSTSAAVQSDAQNDSAASKTSKAVHEASETANLNGASSNETQNNSSSQPSSNKDVKKISPQEVGLSSNTINQAEIEGAKNKAGKSTQNAAFEKSGEKDVANKEFNEEASDQAANTAADVHMSTNEKLAKENAELAKKLKDKEQRKELENENERLRSELGMPSRKKGFINKLKTAWNKIQGVDKNKDNEKLANGEKAGAGHMLMRFGKKSLFAACLLAGGTLTLGKKAFKSASKHILSAMDKGAVRGFAPGDVHAPGSANKSQDLER